MTKKELKEYLNEIETADKFMRTILLDDGVFCQYLLKDATDMEVREYLEEFPEDREFLIKK